MIERILTPIGSNNVGIIFVELSCDVRITDSTEVWTSDIMETLIIHAKTITPSGSNLVFPCG